MAKLVEQHPTTPFVSRIRFLPAAPSRCGRGLRSRTVWFGHKSAGQPKIWAREGRGGGSALIYRELRLSPSLLILSALQPPSLMAGGGPQLRKQRHWTEWDGRRRTNGGKVGCVDGWMGGEERTPWRRGCRRLSRPSCAGSCTPAQTAPPRARRGAVVRRRQGQEALRPTGQRWLCDGHSVSSLNKAETAAVCSHMGGT